MSADCPPDAVVRSVLAELDADDIRPLVLRQPAADHSSATGHHDRQLRLAIPRRHVSRAVTAIERLPWRYSWDRHGLMRAISMAYYWWDGGTDLELWWGGAAAPLPSAALARLHRALWRGATLSPAGVLEPEPTPLLVHLAVQALRPGRSHDEDWQHFLHCRSFVADLSDAQEVARDAGVERALATAVAHARRSASRPRTDQIFDGVTGIAWRAARAVQSRTRPTRLRHVLAGVPRLGDTTIRCRTAGVETCAGPGVFVPTPDADLFVEMALKHVRLRPSPVVVEIGTGCGAIALALAHRRPDAEVHATDLSTSAIRWSRRNAARLGAQQVQFYRGSVLDPLPYGLRGRVDVLIANLPFYPANRYAPVGSVPRNTIQGGGDDGLSLVRQLASGARTLVYPSALMLLQMFATQWEPFTPELEALGYVPAPPRSFGSFVIGPAHWHG
jgi:methylase of polypeptide subunit release factors